MQSPFDQKNKTAAFLDKLALRLLVGIGCFAYFLFLWQHAALSLVAGLGLFALVLLSFSLLEKRTHTRRDRLRRERIGGAMAIEELILLPNAQAAQRICTLLCQALHAQPLRPAIMRYQEDTWLVRCAQCLQGSSVGESDVLSAHRARAEAETAQCLLVSTGLLSPAAIRAAAWFDPPIRLIDGKQLAALAGRLHPATDEDIAALAKRRRKPFSLSRLRAIALSPTKLRQHLLCAFLLLLMYLSTRSMVCLISCLLSFLLAIACHRANRPGFTL